MPYLSFSIIAYINKFVKDFLCFIKISLKIKPYPTCVGNAYAPTEGILKIRHTEAPSKSSLGILYNQVGEPATRLARLGVNVTP